MGFLRRDFLKGLAAALLAPVPVIRPNLAPVPQEPAKPQASPLEGQGKVIPYKAGEAIPKGALLCYDHDTRYVFPACPDRVRPFIGIAVDSNCRHGQVKVLVAPRPAALPRLSPRQLGFEMGLRNELRALKVLGGRP